MDYVQALTELENDGADALWRSVHAMPKEKLDWKTAETARTARDVIEEIVMTTGYSAELISSQRMPEMGSVESKAGKSDKKDMAELEKDHRANIKKYLEAVKNFPVEDLLKTLDLPWGKMTFLQCIAYPYWNMIYHWGQINYIQTMYGDKEMH